MNSDIIFNGFTLFLRPQGRTEITTEVPESMDMFMISAFVIHPTEGLSLVKTPVSVGLNMNI